MLRSRLVWLLLISVAAAFLLMSWFQHTPVGSRPSSKSPLPQGEPAPQPLNNRIAAGQQWKNLTIEQLQAPEKTGFAHNQPKFSLEKNKKVIDVLPTLLAAANQGDSVAAVRAATYLTECAELLQSALTSRMEDATQAAGLEGLLAKEIRNEFSTSEMRFAPILDLLERRFPNRTFPGGLSRYCEGVSFRELRRATSLLERSAANGNPDAQFLLGSKWADYAALRIGILNLHTGTPFGLDEQQMLAARFPEAAAMQDRALAHLISSAQGGNIDAILSLRREAVTGTFPGSEPAMEQAYFWQHVLLNAAPEVARDMNERAFRSNSTRSSSETSATSPIQNPDYFNSAEYYGLSNGRAAQIRAAAEAMARRCCQRKTG